MLGLVKITFLSAYYQHVATLRNFLKSKLVSTRHLMKCNQSEVVDSPFQVIEICTYIHLSVYAYLCICAHSSCENIKVLKMNINGRDVVGAQSKKLLFTVVWYYKTKKVHELLSNQIIKKITPIIMQ